MRKLSDKEIARLLSRRGTPEPPAGLGQRIKAEIPEPLEVGGGALEAAARDRVRLASLRPLWMLAATLLVVVGAGFMAVRLLAPPDDIAREIALGGVTPITDIVVTVPERSTVEKQKLAMADDALAKAAPAPAPPAAGVMAQPRTPESKLQAEASGQGIVGFTKADDKAAEQGGQIELKGESVARSPQAAGAGTLDVAVSDGREPLPGATITVRKTDTSGFEPRTAVSDGDGRAELGVLPAGDYRVTSDLHGFRTSEETVHVPAVSGSELDIVMRQARVAEEITVTGGAPAGYRVSARARSAAGTDQEGAGTAGRRAKEGEAPVAAPVTGAAAKSGPPAVSTVHQTITVVVRSAAGAPAAGVPVSLVLLDRRDARPLEAVTGGDGAVAFAGVPSGRYRAIARPPSGSPVVLQPVVVSTGTSQTVELRLPPPLP